MDIMPLAHLGDKLAVGAVGIGDKPVIHLTHTQNFLDHLAGITLAQLHLFGKEFGAANFYGVGIRQKTAYVPRRYISRFML